MDASSLTPVAGPLAEPRPPDGRRRGRLRARLRRVPSRPPAFAALAVGTAVLVALPLIYILIRSLEGGFGRWAEVALSAATLKLVTQTLALAGGALALSLVVAVPAAWLVARTDLPWRRGWAVLAALPLVFPSYVAAFAWVAVFKGTGYLSEAVPALSLPWLAYGYGGAVAVLGLFTYPYLYLLMVASLRDLDPALEESSRALGAGRWRTFFQAVLPQVRPALYGGGLLVVLYTLSDFGAVSIVRYNTFTLSIFHAYQGLFDRTVAATLATVLVALSLGFLLLEARLSGRLRSGSGRRARRFRRVALGSWRGPALAFFGVLTTLTVGLPLAVVVGWGFRAAAAGLGADLGRVASAALGSGGVALAAALVAVALAVPVAAWAVRYGTPAARLTERVSSLGYALPGLVIALSLVFFASRWARPLYQSLALLVAAYVLRFLPEALAAARASLKALPPSFEEAARSLGRSRWSVLTTLTVPLVRRGLLAGGGLVFLTSMKELPATLLLRPIGFETLATRVWSTASEGIYSQAALPALLLVLASAAPVYFLVVRPAISEGPREGRP